MNTKTMNTKTMDMDTETMDKKTSQTNHSPYPTQPSAEDVLALTEADISKKLTIAMETLLHGTDLTYTQMREVMLLIMQGKCPDAVMSGLLVALRIKGESIDEISAAAAVMRELSLKVHTQNQDYLVDIVGTGGDGANLFNVSTASALVASCAGARVAKHGNRSVSSKSGSSDLLDMAGIRLDLTPEQTLACLETQNLGFLFAPNHHPAIRHAMPVRRALGVRTLFNILGPLTNPAGVKRAVIGVFTPKLCEPLAHVFKQLGDEHIMVVSSNDGLDEISLAASTHVAELKDGKVSVYELNPEDVGIDSGTLVGLDVASPAASLDLITQALATDAIEETNAGTNSSLVNEINDDVIAKARDMIALNAGAAIYVAGRASNLANGVNMAQSIIHHGTALIKLKDFAAFTQNPA